MDSKNTGRSRGRPRMTDQLRNDYARRVDIAAKRMSLKAFQILCDSLDERKTPGLDYKVRLDAAKEIMARGLGKPKQQIEASVTLEGGDALVNAMTAARERTKKAKE